MHPNPRRVIPILSLVVLAGAVWWYFGYGRVQAEASKLSVSGTIEATQVTLAPEMGGHVLEILASKGDMVQAGQVLVRFEDSLLQAQLRQAQAALAQAQANYELVAAGPPPEQQQTAIAAAELELINAQQALDELYEKANLMAAKAAKDVADGRDAVRLAERRVESLTTPASQTDIDIADYSPNRQ